MYVFEMIVVYGYIAASYSLGVACILGANGCVMAVDFQGFHLTSLGPSFPCGFFGS